MAKRQNWREYKGTLVPHLRNNGEAIETKGAVTHQWASSPNLSETVMKIEDIADRREEVQTHLQAQLAKHRDLIQFFLTWVGDLNK